MSFNSLSFLLFFPVTTALYFILPHSWRWALLLLASCIFYMAFIPAYILILFATIIVDYVAGILIERSAGRKRKSYLILSIISNVGFLAFFKYYNFAASNITALAGLLHWNYSVPILAIILPIGLSFHTFQAMSYTIEVYRGQQTAERHLGIYALYVMFFPQLVAGPIERPQNLLPQFRVVHTVNRERIASGLRLMLWGFFKKIVIADNAAVIVNRVYNNPLQYHGLPLIIATLFFSIQIYCDFSGYSNIALGAAETLGFKLMKNFDRPYLSRSIAEFWRRWHISLSTWFRDYVYIPLGGNRVSAARNYFNLLLVFFISGLWHGAAWTFVLWGTLHGAYLVVSRVTEKLRLRFVQFIGLTGRVRLHAVWQTLFTFALVSVTWIFFRARAFSDAWYILSHLAPLSIGPPGALLKTLAVSYFDFSHLLLAIAILFFFEHTKRGIRLFDTLASRTPWIRWTVYNLTLLWIIFFGFYGVQPFIYFQF